MIKSFAACALTAGLAGAQEYFMLQSLPDVDDFVNNLQEKAMRDNGHRKRPAETIDEYQGHYDFEPVERRHREREHPLHDNREEDNAPPTEVSNEEVTICFVKAYARKPLGPPARNVIPMNYQNGIPSWHMLENYYDEFGNNSPS